MTPEQRKELRDMIRDCHSAILPYVDSLLAAERAAVIAECATVCRNIALTDSSVTHTAYHHLLRADAAIRKLGEKRE